MKLSKKIEQFNSLCRNLKNSIDFAKEHLSQQDCKNNDLRHELELEKTTYTQRAQIVSKMRQVLRQRRKYKDEIEVGKHLAELADSPEGRAFLKKLDQVLGATRKIENYHENRTYRKRCSDEK